jgi:hypothetical protein
MLEAQLNQGMRLLPKHFEGGLDLRSFYGNVYYVRSGNGSNTANNGLTPSSAFATVAGALGSVTTLNDDVIVVLPGHAETVTTAIAASKAATSIIGLGSGLRRPAITGNAAIDVINITGANVLIDNLYFPAPGTDAQTADINVAAAGAVIRNTRHIGSFTSVNKVSFITIATGGDDLLIDGMRTYNTVVDVVIGIAIEAAVARFELKNSFISGDFSTGALTDAAVTATLAHIHHSTFKNTKAATAVLDFTGNSTGIVEDCFVSGRHTTLASNIVEGSGMDFNNVKVVEQPALNGLLHPDADAD